MDRTEYNDKLSGLLDMAHQLHTATMATMTALKDGAGDEFDAVSGAEWHALYRTSNLVGVISDMLTDARWPRRMFTEERPEAVPMVCTSCYELAVETVNQPGVWGHVSYAAMDTCPARAAGEPIRVMVAAGAPKPARLLPGNGASL